MTYSEAHAIILAAYLWTPEAMALADASIDHGKANAIAEMLTARVWHIEVFNRIESRLVANGILSDEIAQALLTVRSIAYSPWEY